MAESVEEMTPLKIKLNEFGTFLSKVWYSLVCSCPNFMKLCCCTHIHRVSVVPWGILV